MNAKGSAEVLSHLLHAMDDDLESDNLFTSVSKSLGSPLSSATASQQPTQSGHARKPSDAETLLRELELEDNDDDLTALSVSSPSVQAEAQQPEVAKAAAGISLGNAAASLADCEDTGTFNSWAIPSDDDDLPIPVQWESPASASPPASSGSTKLAAHEQGELVNEPSLSPTSSANSAPAEDCGGTRRSAITAMFEQKIAVAEAERRTAIQRAPPTGGNATASSGGSAAPKMGAGTTNSTTNNSDSLPPHGDARDVFFNDDDDEDAKDVFFNDLELNSKDAKDVFFADDDDDAEDAGAKDAFFGDLNNSSAIDADAKDDFFGDLK